jgi:hypothetical protein
LNNIQVDPLSDVLFTQPSSSLLPSAPPLALFAPSQPSEQGEGPSSDDSDAQLPGLTEWLAQLKIDPATPRFHSESNAYRAVMEGVGLKQSFARRQSGNEPWSDITLNGDVLTRREEFWQTLPVLSTRLCGNFDSCLISLHSGRSRPSRHQKLLTATNTSFRRTTFYLILSISITRRWTPFSVFSTALRSRRVYVSACICGTRGLHAFSSWSAQSDPHWLTTLGSSLTALRCLADGSTSIKYSWSASPSSHLRSFMICRSTA